MDQQQPQSPLQEFGQDITQLAKEGELDPVIGRDEEIRRVMQVLSRRTKNNPVLIGEPGVGKTAIVEALAQRIISGNVPESLKHRRLITLEISSLVAGASYKGQFEQRLQGVLKEVDEAAGEIILFVDEIHTMVGAGGGEGSINAGNMLKPALARGKLHMIGATTLSEYRQYIEKDAALERRFQPVYVGEPSFEDTIAILRGLQDKYEVHHGVHITDDAIIAATRLSSRYIPDRFLPDKAVDLIDEATSSLKIQLESMPIELDRLQNRTMQLEIEKTALKKDRGQEAKDRKKNIELEIDNLKLQSESISQHWSKEKNLINKVNANVERLESLRNKLEIAERDADLTTASRIKYGDIPEAKKALETARSSLKAIPSQDRLLREAVTPDDVATVVARWTGIPVERLVENEASKLSNLASNISSRVIGQKTPIQAIAGAIRRSRAGLSEENRPIGSFLFLGPTGVGKTEVAKALSSELFDDESSMVRIDMSEYMERHAVSRLIGSPPGYVGHEDGGQLTEAIRRRPYSVVLFDEIEKAHPDALNILLQVLDDGRLTDSRGRLVNFTNTIIIMTSNIGSERIIEYKGSHIEEIEPLLMEDLKKYLRPEFINRIDDIAIFNRITEESMMQIVEVQLERIKNLVMDSRQIKLKFDQSIKEYLSQAGYSSSLGVRPLNRLIQREILNPLAVKLIDDKVSIENTEMSLSRIEGETRVSIDTN